ncbi:MAG TPA: hypothetical protein VIZ43_26615 [Trebonia sp.]
MASPGGTADSGSSAGLEADFGKLLISDNFTEQNCRDYPLTTCVRWLGWSVHQLSMREDDFREDESDLHRTLVEIRDNLVKLYRSVNRLCEGESCYLSVTLGPLPSAIAGYYNEFLAAYDGIRRILRQYIAYANHYEVKYAQGAIPDAEPEDIQEKLFANFALLKEALVNLAEELNHQAAKPASPGPDAPDGPERQTA